MSKQIVIRTYDDSLKGYDDGKWFPNGYGSAYGALRESLEQGYKIIMCHHLGMCLEYILEKEIEVENDQRKEM